MAKEILTDEQVELEIERLLHSDAVKLAKKETRIKLRRRQYMYTLRMYEKKGKQLAAQGITLEELEEKHPGATLGRPHLAEKLVELGAAQNVKEAFRKYLAEGRSCYVPRKYIPFAEGAKLIQDCGGVCVLAHPLQYGFDRAKLDGLAKEAAALGFKGMEIYYSGYTQKDTQPEEKLFEFET